MKNCGHTTPCGCNDSALTTPPPCNTEGSCASDAVPCSEIFCLDCLNYCNDDLEATVAGEVFTFKKGQNLNGIVQALIAVINDPACGAYTAIDLKITEKSETTLTITWDSLAPICVNVEWSNGITTNTSPLFSETVKKYTITGLTSNTEYKIRILTDTTTCSSVKLVTKTL